MLQHKGLTAMEARRRSMPGESKPDGAKTHPNDEESGHESRELGEPGDGDGIHHHEMHGPDPDDGSYSSVHTHPDGHKTPMHHDDYSDAKDHMDAMHGEGGDEDHDGDDGMSHDEPDGDEPEDLASMYDNG